MPPKQNNEKGAKGKNKRKAKSPLVVDDQCTRNNKERVSEHSSNSVNRKTLRFNSSMNQNDCQNMNMNPCLSLPVTSPVMNFTPLHYGMPSPRRDGTVHTPTRTSTTWSPTMGIRDTCRNQDPKTGNAKT